MRHILPVVFESSDPSTSRADRARGGRTCVSAAGEVDENRGGRPINPSGLQVTVARDLQTFRSNDDASAKGRSSLSPGLSSLAMAPRSEAANVERRRLLGALVGLCAAGLPAYASAQVGLQRVRMAVDGETTRVVLDLAAATHYELFALENPHRLVVDLRTARALGSIELPTRPQAIVTGVRHAARNGGDLRVVFDLRGPVDVTSFTLLPGPGASHRLVIDMVPDSTAALRVASAQSSTPAQTSTPARSASTSESAVGRANVQRPELGAESRPEPQASSSSVRSESADAIEARAPERRPEPPAESKPESQSGVEEPPRQPRRAAPREPLRDVIVAIDAGHGGHDPGAIGPGGTREKEVVLEIARRLATRVDAEPGMRALMIRTGDYFLPLRERVNRARRGNADVFLSIHADAAYDRRVQGSSVYMLSQRGATSEAARFLAERENAADSRLGSVPVAGADPSLAGVLLEMSQSGMLESSQRLADQVIGELHRVGKVRKPQVERANFAVLRSPDVPAILVEAAFISNPTEERRLRTASFQNSLADALLTGLRAYFSVHAPPGTIIAEGRPDRHIIAPGESLSVIAARYGVPVPALREANQLSGDRIHPGQVLVIPVTSASY